MSITENMRNLAGAIRSRAREHGHALADLTDRQVNELGDAQAQEQPNSIAGQYYMECDEWHWRRVCAQVRRGR